MNASTNTVNVLETQNPGKPSLWKRLWQSRLAVLSLVLGALFFEMTGHHAVGMYAFLMMTAILVLLGVKPSGKK